MNDRLDSVLVSEPPQNYDRPRRGADLTTPGATSARESILCVENLVAGYGEAVLLDHVSFTVNRGEVFMIVGGSGSGKSTLLKHIIGLNAPIAGRVLIDGDDIVTAAGPARQGILKKIGVMYQSGALFQSMTLLENVRLPLEEYTGLDDTTMDLIARMKLDLVGLAALSGHLPSQISGGEQKRAAIARAMALDPPILFLDEPSAGLDPVTSAGLDQLTLRLARSLRVTFVIVSHELDSIFGVADRVILLERDAKGILAEGDPHKLRDSNNPVVRRFFRRQAEMSADKEEPA